MYLPTSHAVQAQGPLGTQKPHPLVVSVGEQETQTLTLGKGFQFVPGLVASEQAALYHHQLNTTPLLCLPQEGTGSQS